MLPSPVCIIPSLLLALQVKRRAYRDPRVGSWGLAWKHQLLDVIVLRIHIAVAVDAFLRSTEVFDLVDEDEDCVYFGIQLGQCSRGSSRSTTT